MSWVIRVTFPGSRPNDGTTRNSVWIGLDFRSFVGFAGAETHGHLAAEAPSPDPPFSPFLGRRVCDRGNRKTSRNETTTAPRAHRAAGWTARVKLLATAEFGGIREGRAGRVLVG